MPVSFLSETERLRFNSVSADLSTNDLIVHFTLTDFDLQQIPRNSSETNRVGFALQLVLLGFLGFHLPDVCSLPKTVVDFVATQIEVEPEALNSYGEREQTRTDHQRQIEKYLGFRHPIYSGIILAALGFGVFRGSLWQIFVGILLWILFYFKSRYEEQLLTVRFDEYVNYRRHTSRFFPFL